MSTPLEACLNSRWTRREVGKGSAVPQTIGSVRGWAWRSGRPEFDSDICGEGRVGEISLSSREEASPGAGVCLRGLRLA